MADYSGLIRDVIRFQEAAFAGTGLDGTLPPPATEEELASAEEDLGFALPGELKALYRFCRGGTPSEPAEWLHVRNLAKDTTEAAEGIAEHYLNLGPLPAVREGPKGHNFLCFHDYEPTMVVEAGEGSRVWEYHVHSIDSPFLLAAGSLSEYWSNLASLAEAGWYRATNEAGVGIVPPYIDATDDSRDNCPAYLADLERLGLGHLDFYL